jgi:hypothetical protein
MDPFTAIQRWHKHEIPVTSWNPHMQNNESQKIPQIW